MKYLFLITSLISLNSFASDKKLTQTFLDAAQVELEEVHNQDEVGLGTLELVGKLKNISSSSTRGTFTVEGEVFAETYDAEFGDPVYEVEATCRATFLKKGTNYQLKKINCNE